MTAYYSENDPYAAQWLRNLIAAKLIAPGDVDERSIKDVRADDLRAYTQCHFFAGIGGWSIALRLAGWPDDLPVWTGSCPCQPFSAAGKRQGFADERHLWPVWFKLVAECKPAVVFGEQVSAAIRGGWLDAVFADLEGEGYACGATVLPACGVGAPHIRQRLYFASELAESTNEQRERRGAARRRYAELANAGESCILEHAASEQVGIPRRARFARGADSSFWTDAEFIPCTDGKARPVEPGTFPLVNGATARVGRLRAYGNAIVAPLATEFIAAAIDCGIGGLNVGN